MAESNTAETVHEEYFRSYADVGVQELMIKDKPRTLAYKQFLEKNVNLIKNKVVLDVGAGTGILSLFAARSGARKVYAVEASDIANLCQEIVKVNKYERVLTVIKGVMETIELPEKVDVIISEWMGFYLLHESMLESVLYARDKWLKDDGILLPSHAAIYACPVNMTKYCKENVDCWTDVYDFDFSPLFEQKVAALLQQPAVLHLKEDQLLSNCELLAKFDLKSMEVADIEEIEEQMSFVVNSDSELHGFALWFDVRFTPDLSDEQYGLTCMEKVKLEKDETHSKGTDEVMNGSNVCHVTLDTSPLTLETHWKQTVCFLPASVSVKKSETIYCRISLSQEPSNKRHYNISLEMLEDFESSDSELEDEEDAENHPVPCNCGAGRCNLILAIMEKYDAEQMELEMEAEFTEVSAEVQAAQTLDNDSSILESDLSAKDDSLSNSTKDDK
ncbi:protein arginine N-methyltransferase 6-like [Mercenaria mercenaria]|uniref:protein arginine N-methyltransferase 6-like n=1 Tax=Mercenaria mercenaria TaxID=6596 RepID=UPI00234E8917|nr:protein arginine N-methyltransferase 6-like [Mercenaria mercenaria]XP_045180886.2 protein arginine N-methyltransferase 6-like [Mercenaria mercenaria]XP_045180887.2 protein arginine N-methyltransferase 6-like [Mercenaria mercenaria]XP_053382753.1 protein arginine N-methyltransferase 6-like [Mercenaria mercenaria]